MSYCSNILLYRFVSNSTQRSVELVSATTACRDATLCRRIPVSSSNDSFISWNFVKIKVSHPSLYVAQFLTSVATARMQLYDSFISWKLVKVSFSFILACRTRVATIIFRMRSQKVTASRRGTIRSLPAQRP
jgi:hypothetical protein